MNTREQYLTIIFFCAYFVGICRGFEHLDPLPHVIAGEPADIRDFPFQLSLEVILMHVFEHVCGAAVISKDWALTAGHCAYPFQKSYCRLRAGTSIKETGGEIYEINDIIVHSEYDENTLDYDIAALRVSRPFSFSDVLQPITLAQGSPFTGTPVVFSGWGCVSSDGTKTDHLQKASLKVVDRNVCTSLVQADGGHFTPRMVCGTFPAKSKIACSGDSGGPVVSLRKELVGLVSWSNKFDLSTFTNVAYLRNWIRSVTNVR